MKHSISSTSNDHIAKNLELVKQRIKKICVSNNISLSRLELIVVSKTRSDIEILSAINAGHLVFAENRVQEAQKKWPKIKQKFPQAHLHLIGPLQTNKISDAIKVFDVIQTLDRPRVAIAIAEEMAKQGKKLPCFIQVNIGDEPQKSGIEPNKADKFINECRNNYGLEIKGLMCIPPKNDEPSPYFAFLKEIANRNNISSLSMGMSADYVKGIELGATHIRLGQAIFGYRK